MYLYLAAKGNSKVTSSSPHPRLIEYNRLTFFWDKFGLNKFDLENVSDEWKSAMYLVSAGVERARNASSSGAAAGTTVINSSKTKQVKKLM